MDDHDIRNGIGILAYDSEPDTIEYTIARCAYDVYEEYQARLWREKRNVPMVDNRYIRYNDLVLYMMDVRTPRTFCFQPDHPYMGREQYESIINVLRDPSVRDIILISSIPIIMGNESMTNVSSLVDLTYDIKDSWAYGNNKIDHMMLLRGLQSWKETDMNRNVILVGGDIHFYMESTVKNSDNKLLFTQFVTSPITNVPTLNLKKKAQDVFFGDEFSLYDTYNIRHTKKIHSRNYMSLHKKNGMWIRCVKYVK
jgi:hypothetical protein